MSRIELTGLRADLPIGAMAAFGCLRVCQRLPLLKGSKLAWGGTGVEHAVLVTASECSPEDLVLALVEDVKTAPGRRELTWRDQIKTAMRDDFRAAAGAVLEETTSGERECADWFAAFGTDLALDREGKVDATPFDMSVARQRFLADAAKLAAGLAAGRAKGKSTEDSYREALFGPWRYEDDQHSLGWDPSTMKLGAFTYKAPTGMANAGVRAAVWLALESLPLFPCFYSAKYPRGLGARGFRREGRDFVLYWPVWDSEIRLETLSSLLALNFSAGDQEELQEELQARGIRSVYRSARYKPNKYLTSFRPPELLFGGTDAAAGR
jgi:hypothetical protein